MQYPGGALNLERRELKYRITPEQVAPVRALIARYCEPDRAADIGGYVLSSLYFDTPDLLCYRDYLNREPERFKMRVRRYTRPGHFLEVKARHGDVFRKTRVTLAGDLWPAAWHDPRVMATPAGESAQRGFNQFMSRLLLLGARPSVVIRYRREAWSSTVDDYARATFDHQLEAALPEGPEVPIDDGPRWVPMDHSGRFGLGRAGLVLELKCERAVPRWMLDLMQRFNLYRQGFSKYAAAIETVRRLPRAPQVRVPSRRLRRGGPPGTSVKP